MSLRRGIASCAVLACVLGAGGIARAQDLLTEAAERVLPLGPERYEVTITRSREGREHRRAERPAQGTWREDTHTWRGEPTRLRVSLVAVGRRGLPDTALHLAAWEGLLEEKRAEREEWAAWSGTPMAALAADPDYEAALDALAKRAEDAALLLEILLGLQEFAARPEPDLDHGLTSPPPTVTAGPAQARSHWASTFSGGRGSSGEEEGATQSLRLAPSGWSARDHREEARQSGVRAGDLLWATGAAKRVRLVLWRFDPEAMRRIDVLARELPAIQSRMRYVPQLADPRARRIAEPHAAALDRLFVDAFADAVEEIARHAWHMSPQPPPAGFWARVGPDGERAEGDAPPTDSDGVPWIADGAALHLPELPGNRLAMLEMPAHGLPERQPPGPPAKALPAGLRFAPAPDDWPARAERRAVVETPGLERHAFGGARQGPHARSVLHRLGTGPDLEGGFTLTYALDETRSVNQGSQEVRAQARETIRVAYTIAPADGEPEDLSLPIVLSVAHPVGGEIVPRTEPLAYGDAFYVEGRLEEPATRRAYRVTLFLNGAEQGVFLRPVEGEPTLLRSGMLYLIWDVEAERSGVELPEGHGG